MRRIKLVCLLQSFHGSLLSRVITLSFLHFQIRDEFEETVDMSTYLIAFVVCDFELVSAKTNNNVTVSVIASREKISQADFALDAAVKMLDFYDDFFGLPYPLAKQGWTRRTNDP